MELYIVLVVVVGVFALAVWSLISSRNDVKGKHTKEYYNKDRNR